VRILLIHNTYQQPGGEDVVFRSEGELLARNGHTVEQMLFNNDSIRSWYDRLRSGLLALYNPISARAIQQKIKVFVPEIIHVHNFTPLVSPSVFFVANRNCIPVAFTLHNFRLLCPSATLFHKDSIYEDSIHSLFPWDAVRKGVYRNSILQTAAVASVNAFHNLAGTWHDRVDRYITPTSFAREKFTNSRLSLPGDKVVVKPSSVESPGKGTFPRQDFLLFVGRLAEEKGIRTLLDGAGKSGSKLVIIGDGPLRKLVEARVSGNPNITYLGFQERETVVQYMKDCRALLFPSIWYEGGTPLTILEAFSTGTLVLASRLGAMVEMIDDQENGLHFEAGNANDMASKIREIEQYPERSRRIAEEGYRTYLSRYTPEKNYEQLIEIYQQAIAERQKKDKLQVGITSPELESSNIQ
jgi:glycosyltransferase involved in cell wall biosynthesis